jgi:hypothetical protein
MAQIINVSYDTTTCTVVCENITILRSTGTIQWVPNAVTINSISNFSPPGLFSTPPSARNNWTGRISGTADGPFIYTISATPANPGNCVPGLYAKTPQITINPAHDPGKKKK